MIMMIIWLRTYMVFCSMIPCTVQVSHLLSFSGNVRNASVLRLKSLASKIFVLENMYKKAFISSSFYLWKVPVDAVCKVKTRELLFNSVVKTLSPLCDGVLTFTRIRVIYYLHIS